LPAISFLFEQRRENRFVLWHRNRKNLAIVSPKYNGFEELEDCTEGRNGAK
jgi:hypothetical protein